VKRGAVLTPITIRERTVHIQWFENDKPVQPTEAALSALEFAKVPLDRLHDTTFLSFYGAYVGIAMAMPS
jgi:hypothetical protein